MSITRKKRWNSLVRRALLGPRACRRVGKVARLPEKARERLNSMLLEGHTYRSIIDKLNAEGLLPYPLSEDNISNWRSGGYREWLKDLGKLHLFFTFSSPIMTNFANTLLDCQPLARKPSPSRSVSVLGANTPRTNAVQKRASPTLNP